MSTDLAEQQAGSPVVSADRQFDFWIGDWDLTWGEDGRGTNSIKAILDGRFIMEEFDSGPEESLHGISLSVYNTQTGKWQQTWVDNQGSYLDFVGGFRDGVMELRREMTVPAGEGEAVRMVMQRMVWRDITAHSIEWDWERSEDRGATWQTLWTIHYKRRQTG